MKQIVWLNFKSTDLQLSISDINSFIANTQITSPLLGCNLVSIIFFLKKSPLLKSNFSVIAPHLRPCPSPQPASGYTVPPTPPPTPRPPFPGCCAPIQALVVALRFTCSMPPFHPCGTCRGPQLSRYSRPHVVPSHPRPSSASPKIRVVVPP